MPRTTRADRAFRRFCRSGDPRALGRVFDLTAAELVKVAGYVLGERERARDVVQSTFLVAIERRAEFDVSRPVMPWLCGIVANLARAEKRRSRANPTVEMSLAGPGAEDPPTAAAERAEFRAALERARAELPEPYQPVLDLHLEHGLNANEIARVLRRPPGTVRTQIVRGLESLRRRLPRGFAVGAITLSAISLAQMRAAVVGRAAEFAGAAGASALGGGTLALWTGGTVMKKSTFVAALAAALLIGTTTWLLVRDRGSSEPSQPEPTAVRAGATPEPGEEAAGTSTPVSPARTEFAAPGSTAQPGSARLEVRVRWKRSGAPAAAQHVQVLGLAGPRGEFQPHSGITDHAGSLLLDDLPEGRATIQVATGARTEVALRGGVATVVEMEADDRVELHGLVVDVHGAPVAAADIWLSSQFHDVRLQRGDRGGHGQHGAFVMQTDSAGRFTLHAGLRQCVAAYKTGHGPSNAQYLGYDRVEGRPRELTLRLTAVGAEAIVRVHDVAGAPVPGAHVLVGQEIPHLTGTQSGAATTPALRGTTDDTGTCRIGRLPPGETPVQVRAAGYAHWHATTTLAAGDATLVDVQLVPGATITGRVTDDTGAPVAGAYLSTGQPHLMSGAATESDAAGRFALTDLSAATLDVNAWQEGVGDVTARLTTQAGGTTTWNPVLTMRPAITGTVLDKSGAPVADAPINTWSQSGSGVNAATRTDSNGRFLVGPLVLGEHYTVRTAFAAGFRARVEVRATDVVPESDIVLQARVDAEPTAEIRGRLVTAGERGLAGLTIVLWDESAGLPLEIAADGTFASRLRHPGQVHVTVSAGNQTVADLGRHDLQAHQVLDLGTVTLPEPGGLRVMLHGGFDPSRMGATLFCNGRMLGNRVLTPDNLEWRELPPGEYLVCVRRGGAEPVSATAAFTVSSGQVSHVELDVRPSRRVTVKFAVAGAAARGVQVTARDAAGGFGYHVGLGRVHDGQTERILLPEGAWTLHVRCEDGRRASQLVRGDATAVTLEIADGN